MKDHTEEMHLRESKLIGPTVYSPELSRLLGAGVRTSCSALARHGKVTAGDVAVLQNAQVVIINAPVHKEGEEQVHFIAQLTERVRIVTYTYRYKTRLESK